MWISPPCEIINTGEVSKAQTHLMSSIAEQEVNHTYFLNLKMLQGFFWLRLERLLILEWRKIFVKYRKQTNNSFLKKYVHDTRCEEKISAKQKRGSMTCKVIKIWKCFNDIVLACPPCFEILQQQLQKLMEKMYFLHFI